VGFLLDLRDKHNKKYWRVDRNPRMW